ncbi:MAG: transcriptional regulator [Caproiciproducens sp.]|nr:transcriptional regulator [Caproiciproducens sp.]
MTLRHFQIFVTVCDTMNMTAAASTLYMSQSAVSQAIAELESHYNVRLFERLSRKLYLTQAGEKLMSYARHIIRMNLDAENEMRNLNQKGMIRIGASVTIGACVLPQIAVGLTRDHPEISIEVTEDNTSRIEQLILHDKLDIGLVEGEITASDIICRPFTEDTLVLICGSKHPFSQRAFIEPHELEQENFILREIGSGTRKTFEDGMQEHHLHWTSSWTCNNADTIKTAVIQELGISVISERAVRGELRAGILRAVDINSLSFKRTFKLIYHKNKYLTQTMKYFINFCFQWEDTR